MRSQVRFSRRQCWCRPANAKDCQVNQIKSYYIGREGTKYAYTIYIAAATNLRDLRTIDSLWINISYVLSYNFATTDGEEA